MKDSELIDLYFSRNQLAIEETKNKYGHYCYKIAYNILNNNEDSEESVNDTYLVAWNSIPPQSPANLAAFLGKITRNLSLKKLRSMSALKRGAKNTPTVFHELEECIPSNMSIDENLEAKELSISINKFLEKLPDYQRKVFICRYWYFESTKDISKRFSFSESKVKMILKRTRDKLTLHLEKEGYII